MKSINTKNKLLNLTKDEQQKPIYRVFTVERFLEVLETKKLILVRPQMWDDPFENYVFNKLSKTQQNEESKEFFEEYKNSLYGQCWSFSPESDAMWRIYAPNKNGIKVKVEITNLEKVLPINYYLGKVNYCIRKKLEMFYDTMKNFTGNKTEIEKYIESIFLKRTAFQHEKEVRLIYFQPVVGWNTEIHALNIEPEELFTEIVFDPRMDKNIVLALTEFINNHHNQSKKIKIKQSKLYTLPTFK